MRVKKYHGFPCRSVGSSTTTAALGMLLMESHPMLGAGVAAASIAYGAYQPVRWAITRNSTRMVVSRWQYQSIRHGGTASRGDHRRVSSARAMRRQAKILKPGLAELSRWERHRRPVAEYSYKFARDGRRWMHHPVEDAMMIVGGPRTGKTGLLACLIADAPGAAIVTSTRRDLLNLTAATRGKVGPVQVFNPSGVGGDMSTVKWTPLAGCADPRTAMARANDMIPSGGDAEMERWDTHARGALGMLMHAAALLERPMSQVQAWAARPNEASAREVAAALRDSPHAAGMMAAAMQFFGNNEKTLTSITTTMQPALRWLLDPRAAELGNIVGGRAFDVERFIADRGTLYLLGKEDGATAALVAAFTAEIARTAQALARSRPSERLDPALLVALDEAALICPVPLDEWTADMGGCNITIIMCAQSGAQVRKRWSPDGAEVIFTNCGTLVVFGGSRGKIDLEHYSALSGERQDMVPTVAPDGRSVVSLQPRFVPVLRPSDLADLRSPFAMIKRRGMPTCIGQVPAAWRRKDLRRNNADSPYRVLSEATVRELEEALRAEEATATTGDDGEVT